MENKLKSLEESKKLMDTLNKKWEECTPEEKLEKVKEELRNMQYLSEELGRLRAEIHQLMNHQHGENGQVLVPPTSGYSTGIGGVAMRRNNLA